MMPFAPSGLEDRFREPAGRQSQLILLNIATEPGVITINYTVEFRPVCRVSITAVRQTQIEVRRQWVKWCLTLNYEDDTQSAAVQTAVLAVASLLGIGAQGIASVLSGTSGALSGLADLIGKQEQQYVFVSRETADGGTLWVDSGPPTSSAVFGPARISDEMCEALVQVFGSGGGTTTIPAPMVPMPPGGD
ncbi:MAG: hypothetical protein IPK19_12265 [Chloroflexi bacterium]|nr:hypothetical protein [Chloroflexota bacterium]